MSDLLLQIDNTQRHPIQDFDLEGKRYRFRFHYSQYEDRHYFDLYDGDDTIISSGIKVLLNVSLLRTETDIRKPPGYLMAYDTTGAETEAGDQELGARVILIYTEST